MMNERSLVDITNIKLENIPCVRIYDTRVSYNKYYVMKGDINESNILHFVSDWEQGRLVVPLRSEPVPQKKKGNVFVVIGDTFIEKIIESDINCFVLFYKSGEYLPKTISMLEEVANKMEEYNNILRVAQIDLSLNEVRDIQINQVPSMKLFLKENKLSPIDYNKENDVKSIINFLKINLNLVEDVDYTRNEGMEPNSDL